VTQRSNRTAGFAAALVVFGVSLVAGAEHASVTLQYSVAEKATSCPDEATFRGLVAARLGYDPFNAAGTRTLVVEFERRGNEVAGSLHLSGENEEKSAERTLRAHPDECFELATSMALVVAVAIDPDATTEPQQGATTGPTDAPPETEPVPAGEPEPPTAAPPAPPDHPRPAAPPPSENSVRLELGALIATGIVPDLTAGVRAGARVDFGTFSLQAEGQFLLPSSRENPSGMGEITAFVIAGSVVPCVDPLFAETFGLDLCAAGSVGVLRSTAVDVTRAEPASDIFATVGPRLSLTLMFSDALGVGASGELPIALTRSHLTIEENGEPNETWAEAPVGFIGGVSLLARLK
jgi:hypothetical protein